MAFVWQSFFPSAVILVIISIAVCFAFPSEDIKNAVPIFNYNTGSNSVMPKTNQTALFLLPLAGIICLAYQAMYSPASNNTRLRAAENIFFNSRAPDADLIQEKLKNFSITKSSKWTHSQPIGEYSIGYLGFTVFINSHGEAVYALYILNEDFLTTTARIQSECSILAMSNELYTLSAMKEMLQPSERATLDKQLVRVLRALENQDDSIKSRLLGKATKSLEEEQKEDE